MIYEDLRTITSQDHRGCTLVRSIGIY